ncbi:YlbF family regulator [Blautia sp. MSJ-19]|uniref:YlbF family regulator n=1 Tax=Blautia sp. MSJ-19 TaxID=2841517 RepID=UPI001C0F23F0|nr:YlbF family regulator [Blautia sp. MSJ-19]MBU5479701.1 YlbF family regulator [Blautia sp. MSJ-19]
MDTVNRNIHLLLNSIQKSEVYKTFKKQEALLEKNPELAERVLRFRADNFRLQNEERGNLLQDAEQLARESAELRRNPEVNAYLDAELALCRMMQQICRTLTEGIDIKIPQV